MSEVTAPIAPAKIATGGLRMQAVTLQEAAALETPAYLFDPAVVSRRYEALREALGTRLVVSFKANNLADLVVRCGHRFADGIELASIGELGVVTGRVAQRRYVNNPAMDATFMRAALISGCDFIVDSLAQARALATQDVGGRVPCALLRLNAAAIGNGTVGQDHFGMDVQQAIEAAAILADSAVQVTGVHCFAGSNTFLRHGAEHAKHVRRALDILQSAVAQPLKEVNLGGGLPADWDDALDRLEGYRQIIDSLFPGHSLLHEAGRAIFGHAGAFLTRVVTVKTLMGRHIAACDGGMAQNFLLASTEGMLRRHATPLLLRTTPASASAQQANIQYVGSSCNRQDVIGQSRVPDDPPGTGDICVFEGCGAYNSSYTVRDFLMLPAARNYLRAM